MIESNYNQIEIEPEKNYLLDKSITDMYDIVKTKENVLSYIKNYKIEKAKSFRILTFESLSSSKIEIDKIFTTKNNKNAKFEIKIDEILDSQKFVSLVDSVLDKLKETFTKIEKNYYDLCLYADYSEEYFKDYYSGGLSKIGVLPIKNSCILKIALAFNLEVLK